MPVSGGMLNHKERPRLVDANLIADPEELPPDARDAAASQWAPNRGLQGRADPRAHSAHWRGGPLFRTFRFQTQVVVYIPAPFLLEQLW